jgi:hypothetical protein
MFFEHGECGKRTDSSTAFGGWLSPTGWHRSISGRLGADQTYDSPQKWSEYKNKVEQDEIDIDGHEKKGIYCCRPGWHQSQESQGAMVPLK